MSENNTPNDKVNTDNWHTRLKQFFNKITAPFTGDKKNTENTPQNNGEAPKSQLNELLSQIDRSHPDFTPDLIVPAVEEEYKNTLKDFTEWGFRDGWHGMYQEKPIKEIATNSAQRLYDLAIIHLNGRLAKLDTEVKVNKTVYDNEEYELDKQKDYLEHLRYYQRHHPRSFSISLGRLCLFIAIFIFCADVCLSLNLVKIGFDLDGKGELEDLFSKKFFTILRGNWLIISLAIGISMLPIYIKFWYDEFAGSQFGFPVIANRKFLQLFLNKENYKENETPLDQSELDHLKKHNRFTDILKHSILVTLLLTIIIFAYFRMEAQAASINDDKYVNNELSFFAFMGISLMFAIISGVCMSVAMTCFQNNKLLKEAVTRYGKLTEKSISSKHTLLSSEEEKNKLQAMIKTWDVSDLRIEQLAKTFFSYYQQSYNRGRTEPDHFTKNIDFFEKIVYWQNKLSATKINTSILN